MADYAKPPDFARHSRSQAEAQRRVRTRRPLNDNVPTLGWHIEGGIAVGRIIGPTLIRIDEDHPEHKEVTGFNAWLLAGGPVTIRWSSNDFSALLDPHTITAGDDNEVMLETPLIIENGAVGGEFLQPTITSVTGTPTAPLCLYFYVRTVPI